MRSADEWMRYAYEALHTSLIPAQQYAASYDDQKGGIPQSTKEPYRVGQNDRMATKDMDVKKAYYRFLDNGGIDAYVYVASCLGFSIRRLAVLVPATFVGGEEVNTEWKVRQSIEKGRSEWGTTLYAIGIKISTWGDPEDD